jgi:hypothetical protein
MTITNVSRMSHVAATDTGLGEGPEVAAELVQCEASSWQPSTSTGRDGLSLMLGSAVL